MARPDYLSAHLVVVETGAGDFGKTDLNARATALLSALDHAAGMHDQLQDDTLYLFLAPEFYWSVGQPEITGHKYAHTVEFLQKISQKHPDWLLVPGTMVLQHGNYRRRVCPILKGGVVLGIQEKVNAVGGDGTFSPEVKAPRTGHRYEAAKGYPFGHTLFQSTFTVDEVVFAIDICNDYRYGVAHGRVADVDVHIITSHSVQPIGLSANDLDHTYIGFGHMACKNDGLVLVDDGSFGGAPEAIQFGRAAAAYRRELGQFVKKANVKGVVVPESVNTELARTENNAGNHHYTLDFGGTWEMTQNYLPNSLAKMASHKGLPLPA